MGLTGGSTAAADQIREIDQYGFAVVPGGLDRDTVESLLAGLSQVERCSSASKQEHVYAIRNLLEVAPAIRELAGSKRLRCLVEPVLGVGAFPVQGIFFDKPADVNWKVPWHQDLSIPVKARVEIPGFGPWSVAPGHRPVIHLEYAVDPLPDGLAWYHDRPLHPSEGGSA